jgi:tetratricopeptide (TPR) repeat protein
VSDQAATSELVVPEPASTAKVALVFIGISLLTILAYVQVAGFEFINFDDDEYVTQNTVVQSGLSAEGIKWAFTSPFADSPQAKALASMSNVNSNWHPLTWLSHMLDCALFGLDAGQHHLTSLLLHLIAANLLLWFMYLATSRLSASALVAGGFALHPLHVESVAWISERKDVLCAVFWMLTMLAYYWYTRGGGTRARRIGKYLLVLVALACALMAKPMAVTLPFVLLLLDFWPLQRIGQRSIGFQPADESQAGSLCCTIIEKLPMFALGIGSCIVTFMVQHAGGAVKSADMFPAAVRFANATIAYAVYLGKTFYPVDLAAYYPHPGDDIAFGAAVLLGLLLLGVTAMIFRYARAHPALAVGWLWFVGTLVPVIGFVQVGSQAYADRYTYIPLIGIFIMIAWSPTMKRIPRPHIVVLLLILLMAAGSFLQARYWRNSMVLFARTVRCTQNNDLAHNSLGVALSDAGRDDEAIEQYVKALQINPEHVKAMNNLCELFQRVGRTKDAIASGRRAVQLKNNYMWAHYNLGMALAADNQLEAARTHLEEAVRLEPGSKKPHNYLGAVLARSGLFDAAEASFTRALAIDPRFTLAMCNRGTAYAQQQRFAEAAHWFKAALEVDPENDYAKRMLRRVAIDQKP